jgi:hypothetical protein
MKLTVLSLLCWVDNSEADAAAKDDTLVDMHITRTTTQPRRGDSNSNPYPNRRDSLDEFDDERLLEHVVLTYRRVVRMGRLVTAKLTSSGRRQLFGGGGFYFEELHKMMDRYMDIDVYGPPRHCQAHLLRYDDLMVYMYITYIYIYIYIYK